MFGDQFRSVGFFFPCQRQTLQAAQSHRGKFIFFTTRFFLAKDQKQIVFSGKQYVLILKIAGFSTIKLIRSKKMLQTFSYNLYFKWLTPITVKSIRSSLVVLDSADSLGWK